MPDRNPTVVICVLKKRFCISEVPVTVYPSSTYV
jgi:hypothetical protein